MLKLKYSIFLMVFLMVVSIGSVCSAVGSQKAPGIGGDHEAPGIADDSESLVLSGEVQVGNYVLRLYGSESVDTSYLLAGINENDELSAIDEKIEANRNLFYPEEEIVFEVIDNSRKTVLGSSDDPGSVGSDISVEATDTVEGASGTLYLKKRITWWYYYNKYNSAWLSREYCRAAVLFIQIYQGKYRLEQYSDNKYKVLSSSTNGTLTASTQGGYMLRGFWGKGLYSSNKAHIVIYFYY